jgi:TonB family protein
MTPVVTNPSPEAVNKDEKLSLSGVCKARQAMLVGVIVLAAASSALAQTPSPARTPTATANEAWTAEIIADLKLNQDQQNALRSLEAMVAPSAPSGLTAEQYQAMTLPQRLDFVAEHMAIDLEKVRAEAQAARRFYGLLSPDQQAMFQAAMGSTPGAENRAPTPDQPEDTNTPSRRPNFSLPGWTPPDWMKMPSANDITRVYPWDAQRLGITGTAVLECVANEYGYLADCVVRSETPEGRGFGNAALETTAYMRMRPATKYGVPVRASVVIPLNFTLQDQPNQATPSAPAK